MNTITSNPFRGLIASAILTALAPSFATVSGAAEFSPPQVIVKFGDLDVSTSQGAAALYGRIKRAADSVCWRMYDSDAAYKQNKDACLQTVIANAVTKVNQPALSAVYAVKYATPQPIVLASVQDR